MSIAQLHRIMIGRSRRSKVTRLGAVVLSVFAFGAAGTAPLLPDADVPVRLVNTTLALPGLAAQLDDLDQVSEKFKATETPVRGDTINSLLTRMGVQDQEALSFIRTNKQAHQFLNLAPGKPVVAETNEDGELISLRAPTPGKNGEYLKLDRKDDEFSVKTETPVLERRIEMATGFVYKSLYSATDAAQIPESVTTQMIEMFSSRIDFSDLTRGDTFTVVYESFWDRGVFVKAGHILAARFVNDGDTYQTLWFDDPKGKGASGYYSFDGKPLKKAFLKSPIGVSRVTSGFAYRSHPISGDWKKHQGVDFSAAYGTPIMAAADGQVEFAGTQNGYGNVVTIKHWAGYSTVYAHLRNFSPVAHKGGAVKQGDIIGYVGTTGWSTGPHLHYEFRVNNMPHNPLALDMPNAPPLSGVMLKKFQTAADDMQHRFAVLNPSSKAQTLAMR